jgi:hypothetical protein
MPATAVDAQRHGKTFLRPSHGENRSSILLGSASNFKYLSAILLIDLSTSSTFLQRPQTGLKSTPSAAEQSMDPKKTIRLLDVLQGLGFSDEAFRLIHHFRLVGRNATINRHRRYCEGLETFADGGTNELVQRL